MTYGVFPRFDRGYLDAAALRDTGQSASADQLMTSLSACKGELLPGFYDAWLVLEREHLAAIFEHHMVRLWSLLQDEQRALDVP